MGETMRRHVAERGRKAMEKEGGVTTDDLKVTQMPFDLSVTADLGGT